jgi:outer membrane protein TolC
MRERLLTGFLVVLVATAGPAAAQIAPVPPQTAPTPPPSTPFLAAPAAAPDLPPIPTPAPTSQSVTFDDAVRLAFERHPDAARAAQAILRAEALLQASRSVFLPSLNGTVTTTILNEERGFSGQVTQPQTQTGFSVQGAFPILAAARWAQATQARDQVAIARIGAEETRRQIALAVSQAYLAVIAQHRQVSVNTRALENGRAHLSYASARLQAGAGSRLNELRAAQEASTDEVLLEASLLALRRTQEALGVLLVADAPVDAAADPIFELPGELPETWLSGRVDIRLAEAEVSAAERVRRDSWKDWLPTGTAAFTPQYVTPAGLFQPSNTWAAVVQFSVPIFDGGQRRAAARQRDVNLELARIDRTDLERRIRSDERIARDAVRSTTRALESAQRAAAQANEVVKITDVAFRAGATTNLEVIDAQRRARDAETAAAVAEDRARQARLDLLVALGRFPR